MLKLCPKCNQSHEKSGKFCSRSCANSRTWSEEDKLKKSISNQGKPSPLKGKPCNPEHLKAKFTRVKLIKCKHCQKQCYVKQRHLTCSTECAVSVKITNGIKTNRIQYRGVWLDSSWELEIAKFLDSKSISWVRPKHLPWTDNKGNPRKYFADFYLPKYDLYRPKESISNHTG